MTRGISSWSFVLFLLGSSAIFISPADGQEVGIRSVDTSAMSILSGQKIESPKPLAQPLTLAAAEEQDGPWTLFGRNTDDPVLNIGGWFQFGYHSQDNGLFNSQNDGFNLHQGWLFAEKVAESKCGELAFGFRFDGMYGIDANDTQAFGNPGPTWDLAPGFTHGIYGWAIPQLYGEVAMGDLSVKIGHFYTLVGYEVVPAPDNFFYSHAITMYNSEPFTHTGAIGTWEMNDKTTIYGGWTAGWDTGFDQFGNGSNFMGGFSRQFSDDVSLTYITTFGDFGARGDDAYSHSFVLDMVLTEKMTAVVQSDLVRVDSTGEDNVGLMMYTFRELTNKISVGTRSEWWKGDGVTGYAPFGSTAPATGSQSQYESTYGINFRPNANLVFRPEYRYQWSPALDYEQSIFGVDMIVTY